jgi:hypothetical protein
MPNSGSKTLSKSVSWIYKKSLTSATQRLGDVLHDSQGIAVSCVTFTIYWGIAFLMLLMSGRVWVKTWAFKCPHKKVCCSKVRWIGGPLNVTKPRKNTRGMQHVGCSLRVVPYGLWHRAAFNVTHFELAIVLVWVVNPRHWLPQPWSVVFIAVYNKCVILLSKGVTLNAAPYSIFSNHTPPPHRSYSMDDRS